MKLLGLILLAHSVLGYAADGAGLQLVATIEMPNVKGRIDHFAVDVKGHRLYVAALGNDTVEVLDTASNRHERSISGFGEPQGVLYLPQVRSLYVANAGGGVDILDDRSFKVTRHIEKLDDADNIRHDASTGSVIVGYGRGALRMLDAETGSSKGDIRLSGHPESFQLERNGSRVFVNVPTSRQVAVVDRSKGQVIATWPVSARSNYPMAFDEKGQRLFIGARSPAVLLAVDTASGKEVAKVAVAGDTDDVFFDDLRKRIYVICGEGQVDVLRQESPDRYRREGSVKTASRARTGLFVPEDGRLYVAAPATGATPARVLIYSAR